MYFLAPLFYKRLYEMKRGTLKLIYKQRKMRGTFKMVRVGTKEGYNFNKTSFKKIYFKTPIRTISRRRLNNSLHEIDFKGGHLN
jgi:hypothetical protein